MPYIWQYPMYIAGNKRSPVICKYLLSDLINFFIDISYIVSRSNHSVYFIYWKGRVTNLKKIHLHRIYKIIGNASTITIKIIHDINTYHDMSFVTTFVLELSKHIDFFFIIHCIQRRRLLIFRILSFLLLKYLYYHF